MQQTQFQELLASIGVLSPGRLKCFTTACHHARRNLTIWAAVDFWNASNITSISICAVLIAAVNP